MTPQTRVLETRATSVVCFATLEFLSRDGATQRGRVTELRRDNTKKHETTSIQTERTKKKAPDGTQQVAKAHCRD